MNDKGKWTGTPALLGVISALAEAYARLTRVEAELKRAALSKAVDTVKGISK